MPNMKKDYDGGRPRKELHIFYILDTSGSMESSGDTGGTKISMLNHGMEETINALKTLAKKNADAKLKIAVLEFNSGCRWVTSNGPEDLEEDFEYEYLKAGGLTDIGAALEELNVKLNRKEYLGSMTGALMPIIIFMTDGYATDDYESTLEKIRNNRWFARGTKIGFAMGDDADVKMLSSVVGNSEAVIKTSDSKLELFERLIKFVSVRSSMLNSKPETPETAVTGVALVKMAKSALDIPEDVSIKLDKSEYNPEPEPPVDEEEDWDEANW